MTDEKAEKPKKATWPIAERAKDMEEEKRNTSIIGKASATNPSKDKKGKK